MLILKQAVSAEGFAERLLQHSQPAEKSPSSRSLLLYLTITALKGHKSKSSSRERHRHHYKHQIGSCTRTGSSRVCSLSDLHSYKKLKSLRLIQQSKSELLGQFEKFPIRWAETLSRCWCWLDSDMWISWAFRWIFMQVWVEISIYSASQLCRLTDNSMGFVAGNATYSSARNWIEFEHSCISKHWPIAVHA